MFRRFSVHLGLAFLLLMLAGTPGVAEENTEREQLKDRIQELQEEMRNAVRNGQDDELRELVGIHAKLMRELAEISRNNHHEAEHRAHEQRGLIQRSHEQRELMQKLGEMARESHELRRAGKNEEAERVMAEIRELQQQLQHNAHSRTERPIAEEKKIDMLHQAAENLEAGGFHEEAREFHKRAERMREELERHLREEHEHQEEHEHEDHDNHDNDSQAQQELIEHMKMMQKVMQQMQHQMRQMQEQLDHVRKELSERKRAPASAQSPVQYPTTPSPQFPSSPYRPRQTPNSGFQPPSEKLTPPTKAVTPTKRPAQPRSAGKADPYRPANEGQNKSRESKKQRDPKPANKKEVKQEAKKTKEVVLSMDSMTFMLDLDSGETMDPPATYRPKQEKMDIVPIQHQPYEQPEILAGNHLVGFKGNTDDWNRDNKELQDKLHKYPLSKLSKMTFDKTESATYFYRTKDGGEGVIQLVELVDSPKGIRIRYRSLN